MPRVIDIVMGPSWPESGGIARAVTLENGWGQVQTYSQRKKAWERGGSSLQSLLTAEHLTREKLEEMGYEEEDIRNILWQPGDE